MKTVARNDKAVSSRRHSSARRRRKNSEEQGLNLVSVNLDHGELDLVSAYSILREVERVYGKIREFVIKRVRNTQYAVVYYLTAIHAG
jgi:hypothetical protein